MTKIEPRVRWLEERARNPYASDPRMATLTACLQAGESIQTFSDDGVRQLKPRKTATWGMPY